MTGNVLIKNRTPSSDVPYLFGLPKQKTTLLRRTSVLRSKTLAEGEFTSPEHFKNWGPHGVNSVGRAAALAEPKIAKLAEGMDLVKSIVVRGKLVSLIFKPKA